MAQTGYTPILIYSSTTASQAPAVGNLTNSTLGSELAINITDGKLFYKDNANAIQVIAWKTTPTTAGGTGLTSYAQGDLLYYDSGTTLTKLAKSTTATRYLSNTGTSNNPAWAQIDLTNGVTGTLPVGNGGTGTSTAFTAGSVVFAGASGVFSQDNANFFWDDTNNRLGIGTAAPGAKHTISDNAALPSAGVITGTNLWVVGANATNNTVLLDAFGSNSLLAFRRASGTAASPTAVTSGSSLANIGARGYGATGYSSGNRASINMSAAETWTDTAQGTRIAFNTTAIGSATLSERMSIENTGDININSGNIVPGTAAKGINFTANTPLAGMTSQLLNWYEEGTWTPNQGAGLTVVGAFSSSGTYVRIGRLVNVNFVVSGATSIAATGGSFLTTNLPFSILAGDAPIGQATNAAPNASVALFSFTTSVIPVNSIAATTSIRCSLTYQV